MGVEGRFLSTDWDLLGTNCADGGDVLVRFGDGQRRVPEGVEGVGVGDLYLELISLVRGRRVVTALFFWAGTNGGLGFFSAASSDSRASIHTIQIRPH